MSRAEVRNLKRLARSRSGNGGSAPEASTIGLLCRSIRFGHRRLAVLRFIDAVAAGGQIPPDAFEYCEKAATAAADPLLKVRFDQAAERLSHALSARGGRNPETSPLPSRNRPQT